MNDMEDKIKINENGDVKLNKENKLGEKEEISKLYKEMDKIKNTNENMNQKIKEKEDIINKLKNENEDLLHKLNNFRVNPNAENNIKFYNSVSVNNNQKEKEKENKKMNLSNMYLKYNTNKILNMVLMIIFLVIA